MRLRHDQAWLAQYRPTQHVTKLHNLFWSHAAADTQLTGLMLPCRTLKVAA